MAYNQTITASGGTGTVTLAVSNIQGAIPGLTVPSSGTGSLAISGTPTAAGTETFTVTATDSLGATHTDELQHYGQSGAGPDSGDAAGRRGQRGLQPDDHGQRRHRHRHARREQRPGRSPGLTVPSSGTGSLAISGTPTATGTETFTVTATDSLGATATANYSITVNPALTLTPATLPADTVGVAYNQTITAGGGTGTVTLAVSDIQNAIPGLTVPSERHRQPRDQRHARPPPGRRRLPSRPPIPAARPRPTNYSITVNPAPSLARRRCRPTRSTWPTTRRSPPAAAPARSRWP